MAFREVYRKQVGLLIRTLPFIAQEDCFALKGGTAINLFVRNMPRLSVDVDLTYLPVLPRAESLAAIDGAMKRIAERIRKGLRGATVTEGDSTREGSDQIIDPSRWRPDQDQGCAGIARMCV